MAWLLRQSTASQEIPLGPFVDSTDGNTAETGLTIANTDIKLQKTGATTQANKNSGGATHIATGDYYTVLDAADTDTLGSLRVKVHVAGALPVWLDCVVLPANVYDSIVLGTDKLDANAVEFAGQTITAAAGVTLPATVASPTNITAGTITTVSGNVAGSVASVTADVGITQAGADKAWGTATRLLTAGTNIALAKGTGVTGFNDLSAAQVNAEVDTALADYDAPTNAEMVARTLAAASYATAAGVSAVETDTQDIQGRLPAALTAAGNMKSDLLRINGTAVTGDGDATPWGPA